MKVREIEGTPEEIGKICEVHNFSLNDYLHDKPKIPVWVLIILGISFLILSCILWTINLGDNLQKITFLTTLLVLGALTLVFHLKYGKWIVTFIVGFFGLIMLSVSLNILTPEEAITTLKDKIESKSE